jgi:hypothetical protein
VIKSQVILNFIFESASSVATFSCHNEIDVLIRTKVGFNRAVQQFLVQVWKTGVEAKLYLEASLALHGQHLLDLEGVRVPEI